MSGTVQLYRPVGGKELELIVASGRRAFPPRLFHQPIFYPVLTFEYAEWIAKNWNATDPAAEWVGVVTQFDVDAGYVSRFEARVAGGKKHQELWVPSEELEEFNRHIVGEIRFVAACYGDGFRGEPVALDAFNALDASSLFIP